MINIPNSTHADSQKMYTIAGYAGNLRKGTGGRFSKDYPLCTATMLIYDGEITTAIQTQLPSSSGYQAPLRLPGDSDKNDALTAVF